MSDLKDNWKEAGKSLGHAFRDLGKTAVKTAKVGIKKVDEWANGSDDDKKSEEKKD